MSKKISLSVVIVAAILTSFYLGYQQAAAQEPFLATGDFNKSHFKLFWGVWEKIKQEYIEREKISTDEAAFEATRGLVRSIKDPYSDFYTKEESKIFEDDLRGSFGGVGMEIGERKGVLTVIAPLDGTPAQKAGLRAGDAIIKINGGETINLTVQQAVSKIRGTIGTKVTLTIMRENWKAPKDFELTRAKIDIQAVKGELRKPDIGLIKISTFNEKTLTEFATTYDRLQKQGARRFILDLRNDPGGFLDVAIKLSEFFVPRGKVIVKELWGPEKRERATYSGGPGTLGKLKMVVLINKGSASASEIFTGALKDNLGTKVLGEKSYGKGSIQQIFEFDDKILKLTVGYWLTPNGLRLEGQGITPDIKLTDKNLDDDKDEVLEQAIIYIKKVKD